jgi:hypothetical protein
MSVRSQEFFEKIKETSTALCQTIADEVSLKAFL